MFLLAAAFSYIHLFSPFPPLWCWKNVASYSPFSVHSSCHLAHPSLCPCHLSAFQSSHPVLWWGTGWPWIPLLLWGNNRPSLLLSIPFSPNTGPKSAGKEGARRTGSTSRVFLEEKDSESKWEVLNELSCKTKECFDIFNNVYFIYT